MERRGEIIDTAEGKSWEQVPRSGRLWAQIAVAALFANAVPYLLFAVAEQTVDSSTAGIINATTPLWTAVPDVPATAA